MTKNSRISPRHMQHVTVRHGGIRAFNSSNLLDFSSNITPLGPTPAVLQALKKCATVQVSEYPDPESRMLLGALSGYLRMPKSHIVIGNGATEIIYNAAFVLGCGRGRILIPHPTFQEYEAASSIYHGCGRIAHFETCDISSDLDSFIRRIPHNGVAFVCNPNNPTGTMLTRRQMLQIIDAAASYNCHMVIDESFIEMSSHPRASIISYVKRYDNLVVLRSMTKSFGLPGIRIGYAAASPHIADVLYRVKVPWSVNHMAEAAGVAALKNASITLKKTRDIISKERVFMQGRLSRIPDVSYCDSAANFILLQTRLKSAALQDALAKKYGILVRDCSGFRGLQNNHIRIAIKSRRDNCKLADALEKIMQ